MKKKNLINLIFAAIIIPALLIIISFLFISQMPVEEKNFEVETLVENLDTPWAIDFLPDDNMIFTERKGRVSILENGKAKIVGNIKVSEVSESGLLGIAVEHKGYLYISTSNRDGRGIPNIDDDRIIRARFK